MLTTYMYLASHFSHYGFMWLFFPMWNPTNMRLNMFYEISSIANCMLLVYTYIMRNSHYKHAIHGTTHPKHSLRAHLVLFVDHFHGLHNFVWLVIP